MTTAQPGTGHWSDCALHREPAYPAGECDCGGMPPPGTWQDIATAPRDGTRILLAVGRLVGSGCYRHARPAWASAGVKDFYVDGGDMPSLATHWMPLPPAPETTP